MVLADSVEPLHYPAIMFSSPSAPRLPFPPMSPLAATNATQSAATLHHSLSRPFPFHPLDSHLPTPTPSRAAIHRCRFTLSLLPCLFNSPSLFLAVPVSPSLSLTPFCWSYCFFSVSCFPLSSFLPSFVNLLLIYWLYRSDFLTQTIFPNKMGLAKCVKHILCMPTLSRG